MLIDNSNHLRYRHVLKGNIPTNYITFAADVELLSKGFTSQEAEVGKDLILTPVQIFMDLPLVAGTGTESKFEGQPCIQRYSTWIIRDTYDNRIKYAKMIEAERAVTVSNNCTIAIAKPLGCIPTGLTNMQVQKVTTCQTREGVIRVLTGRQSGYLTEDEIIAAYETD